MSDSDEIARLRARIAELERGIFEPSSPRVVRVPPENEPPFQRAEATMRELFGRIEIDPARALIGIDEERYVLVRASAFSIDFLDTLVQLYADRGEREALAIARGFLFDIAHTIGLHDARNMHAKMGSREPLEKLSGGPVHFAYTGWALVDIKESSRPVPDEDFCLVYEHPYSFEAAAFHRAGRRSEGPACIMNAGYSSGWCEASFGLELTALEVECRARGDARCAFVMAPPEKIAARVREHFGVEIATYAKSGFDVPTYFERKRAEEQVRRSLVQLREAQDELVRKERLATVGLLVSGVAHEVNTPLGVAVTATSVLRDELAALRARFDENELTKKDLRHFIERAEQAEAMVRSNLDRAAAQIGKFKRASMDHGSEEKRAVDLAAYVPQILDGLDPIVREAALSIEVIADGELTCVTHPGAIAQVLTNFVTNSALHATRGDGTSLAVEIGLARRNDEVCLTYRDAGRGMSDEVKEKAFQPFFTTRRGAGGTGLGLHIVQSLVADVLVGRVELESAPDRGTTFRVTFPVEPQLRSGA